MENCNKQNAEKTFMEFIERTDPSKSSRCENCKNLVYKDGIMTCAILSNNDNKYRRLKYGI